MKRIIVLGLVFLALSCKNKEEESFGKEEVNEVAASEGMPAEAQSPEKIGETVFNGTANCATCHKVDTKTIGPSVQEIAKMYKDKNSNIISFLKGESEAIVDPAQFAVMQANIATTKAMSDDELKGLEAYFYSKL
jgi:cytochrome c